MNNKVCTTITALFCIFTILTMISCQTTTSRRHLDRSYPFEAIEADWIVNGEPIEFEGEQWYPQDGIEVFTDQEMHLLGEYRDVQFFVDKVDVRPFARLYTKFDNNKFRYYKK